ncbi:MAG TPA: M90 family metallopeptidase [Burkholderiales bacterium]|nr:M90 family metallopeptidase [Burkholderiales bacterium]
MSWLRQWRRRRILRRTRIDPASWTRIEGQLSFLEGLDANERLRLRELAILFLHEKEMHGAAGFELLDEVRLSIALQACLPILNLDLSCYAGWVGIVIYPGGFRVARTHTDEAGVVHEWKDELAGETWSGGPVVLSWDDIETGASGSESFNVVIHEFAHKLDMLHKDDADGFPMPHPPMNPVEWFDTLESTYARFCRAVERGLRKYGDSDNFHPINGQGIELPFDAYAAEDPAEFFAVMSEAFFVNPQQLRQHYGRLYEQFCMFYRQDPAGRIRI